MKIGYTSSLTIELSILVELQCVAMGPNQQWLCYMKKIVKHLDLDIS
jgi:hypothetical protein